ncbi:hypothetical protein DFQ28_006289 [Apophysomyces sp. BC1034]|nr:hypothetical protein DFQ30_006161 [Apophysomyces sp. BC1015]KAG0177197.1 hypothetical protein DFQ29_005114 [Apophysomyces sp. BC1021]KAG0187473.1 hypothetical protein DFQ28_006289 [Apophysomyces sp. BC1034]
MDPPKVYIVIYSLYHHIYQLSLSVREGLESKGINATIFQVPETLSDEILEKMRAPPRPDLPVINVNQLPDADGLIFGIPTRFGSFPAQIKSLLDASGHLWAQGSLQRKFVTTFFSSASQHGGQETTALTAISYFAHHGLMYVPFGFANANMFDNDQVIGGSAYGSGTITGGDGARQASEIELRIAKNQGENFGEILNTYVRGQHRIASGDGKHHSNPNNRLSVSLSHQGNLQAIDSALAAEQTAYAVASGKATQLKPSSPVAEKTIVKRRKRSLWLCCIGCRGDND